MPTGVRIDYKALRAVNPETARLAVLEYLDSCDHHVAETARTFGLTRASVYALDRKRQTGSLAVTTEQVRSALSQMHHVYEQLKPAS